MNAEAKTRLCYDVMIKTMKVDSTTIERLRQCAIFEVIVENFDQSCLAVVASDGSLTQRDSFYLHIAAVGMPLSDI